MNKLKPLGLLLVLILLLSSVGLTACGSNGDEGETTTGNGQTTSTQASQTQISSGDLPWSNIPVYPGASLESSGAGPSQWQECKACEARLYVTDDSPEAACEFYKDKMPGNGWDKLVFQSYQEGACTGTWMEDMGDSEGPRVLMTIGKRASDKKTTISIVLGNGCP